MDAIAVRCKSCQHTMKFSAEKAGTRAKCSKCEAMIVIQAEEEEKKPDAAPVGAATPAAPPTPAPVDDDSTGAYGVWLDPELEERKLALIAEREATKKKKDKPPPNVSRKVKAIPDADAWKSIRLGMYCQFLGCIIWAITHVLQGSYLLIGSTEFGEYASLAVEYLEMRDGEEFPDQGRVWDIDRLGFYLGIIAGRAFAGYARFCLTISAILYFLQAGLFTVGYFFYLPVPRKYGMFAQTLTMAALAIFNVLFAFVFKLLPVLGAHGYILIPYLTPEVVLTEYNMERTVPIHVMWSGGGWACFWENMLTLMLRFGQYFEPAFGCIFLWSAGVAIKEPDIASRGRGQTELILGTFFVCLCFQLLSLCGASPVLVNVLRLLYGAWFAFLLMFILTYAGFLMQCRAVLLEKIHPKNELKDDKKDDAD